MAPGRAATPLGVGGPHVTAGRALQVHQPRPVAQQILPVLAAVSGTEAFGAVPAVVTLRAGQPGAPAEVSIGINR